MDPTQFFAASRLIIVAGKGGVGKTTASAALSVAGAKCRLSVLLGRDTVASLSTGVLEARPTWTSLAVGVAGAQRVDWIAFQRRVMTADWLRRLWTL